MTSMRAEAGTRTAKGLTESSGSVCHPSSLVNCDFKRTRVRLGEKAGRDRLGARRGESPFCMCLAPLEQGRTGEGSDKTGGALGTSSRQRSEDLPSSSTFWSFIATGDFACNHRGAQLAFGQIVSSLDTIMIQEGKEMIALFSTSTATNAATKNRTILNTLKKGGYKLRISPF
jgi:hypothetical protein